MEHSYRLKKEYAAFVGIVPTLAVELWSGTDSNGQFNCSRSGDVFWFSPHSEFKLSEMGILKLLFTKELSHIYRAKINPHTTGETWIITKEDSSIIAKDLSKEMAVFISSQLNNHSAQ